ncbi:hypothetical protein [Pseudoalteromonas sp. S16_S37]|uniref:hypothetical protein n=1 Tax=Pseudoalteromonas sp. S16_S37 TaxID=2720228 RepID=UPI001681B274|nr:hypothetical protein [Pseudoalteromonas sp. S16_S37]MBD1583040.1 hypothetical protein [Pseudoalteromonas sp. S16_S37]
MSNVFEHLPQPLNGINWEPSPSDYKVIPTPPEYGDTDFANEDFKYLWGPGDSTTKGRDDLKHIADMGFNTVKMYNWSVPAPSGYWQRDHTPFLSYAKTCGLKVIVPISNFFTGMAYSIRTDNGNEAGPKTGSGKDKVTDTTLKQWITAIVTEIYGTDNDSSPVVMWAIGNEFDNSNVGAYGYCEAQDIAKIASYIQDAEQSLGVPSGQTLPFSSPVTTALTPINSSISATAPYNTLMGGCATQALLNAFTAQSLNDRFIASINSYQTGSQLKDYYASFATVFPSLKFYYGELGWSEGIGGETEQAQNVYDQFNTTIPEATSPSYYYGACLFEFSDELWKGPVGSTETKFGIQTFSTTAPTEFATQGNHSPVWGAQYPIDKFVKRKAYASVVAALVGKPEPSN